MGCVSGTGYSSAPLLIVEGERQFSRFNEQWPECNVLMDSKGYMTKEHFFAWIKLWEEETRPADPTEPRVLFLDNHYSHNVIDATAYLIEHNVRLVALHPHTTHVLCALDCGVFRSLKHWFRHYMSVMTTVVNDSDVSGLLKKAWGKTLTLSVDPVTKKATSTAIRAFERVGLIPFNRDCVDESHFERTDLFKTETDTTAPKSKRPVLTPTPEYMLKLSEELQANRGLPPELKTKLALAPRTQMSQIMTHSEVLSAEIDKAIAMEAENKRKADLPWNKLNISLKEYRARERERKAIEQAVIKTAKDAEKAKKVAEKKVLAVVKQPVVGKKRKVAAITPAKAEVAATLVATAVQVKAGARETMTATKTGRIPKKKQRYE
jgi:hypothetical protein